MGLIQYIYQIQTSSFRVGVLKPIEKYAGQIGVGVNINEYL